MTDQSLLLFLSFIPLIGIFVMILIQNGRDLHHSKLNNGNTQGPNIIQVRGEVFNLEWVVREHYSSQEIYERARVMYIKRVNDYKNNNSPQPFIHKNTCPRPIIPTEKEVLAALNDDRAFFTDDIIQETDDLNSDDNVVIYALEKHKEETAKAKQVITGLETTKDSLEKEMSAMIQETNKQIESLKPKIILSQESLKALEEEMNERPSSMSTEVMAFLESNEYTKLRALVAKQEETLQDMMDAKEDIILRYSDAINLKDAEINVAKNQNSLIDIADNLNIIEECTDYLETKLIGPLKRIKQLPNNLEQS